MRALRIVWKRTLTCTCIQEERSTEAARLLQERKIRMRQRCAASSCCTRAPLNTNHYDGLNPYILVKLDTMRMTEIYLQF